MRIHHALAFLMIGGSCAWTSGCEGEPPKKAAITPPTPVSEVVIVRAPDAKTPPFEFAPDDVALLDEVQRGCFNYLWNAGDPRTGMVPDRSSKPVVSVAGVGFQLSGIVVGIERGWITREQGRERAELILTTLTQAKDIRKAGLFFHFLDGATGGQPPEAYEHVVSTIDSSILLAGVLTASQYFGGRTRELGDAIFEQADWTFFVDGEAKNSVERGFISLGWKPADLAKPTGDGSILPYYWLDCGDEHRLVMFLAVCAPNEKRRVDPAMYYKLRRTLGEYHNAEGETGTFVWFPWSGALFTSIFAHCWIDYSAMGPDDPGAFGVKNRSKVDWWENARRTARMHQLKCAQNPRRKPTLGENAWGLTASDVKDGYAVPGLFPTSVFMTGAIPTIDYPIEHPADNYGDGTIAPYGAGCTIMFEPARALSSMRYQRDLKTPEGAPLLWHDPAKGGYGFQDSFNLGAAGSTPWVAPDVVAIDHGPLLLAIENARSGLIWRIFHAHPWVKAGSDRLKMKISRPRKSNNHT